MNPSTAKTAGDVQAQGAQIVVVYPKPGQVIYDDATFLLGAIHGVKGQAVALSTNGQAVSVSPGGFFAHKLPIKPGHNPVDFRLVKTSASSTPLAQKHLVLEGAWPLQVLPSTPLSVHAETVRPASDLWLSGEDYLQVACSASEGAQVSFTIPGLIERPIPIPPLHADLSPDTGPFLDTREGIFAQLHWTGRRIPKRGYYRASIPVSDLLNQAGDVSKNRSLENLEIILYLKHGAHSLQHSVPGRLSILTQPLTAHLKTDEAVTRIMPQDGARLSPQRSGTRFFIDALEREWCRARLSRDEAVYIAHDDLLFETSGAPLQPASLNAIRTERLGDNAACAILLFSRQPASSCPIQVEALPPTSVESATNRLIFRLYNVGCRCDFIHYPPDGSVIHNIHWRPVSPTTMEVWIDVNAPLAGYDYAMQNGEWRFTVKTLPQSLEAVKILIDPGHGGDESGALGLDGTPEKKINLAVSLLLCDALRAEGFTSVSMTRETDKAVSLPARGKAVLEHNADIVLSMHHNALPDGRDPIREHGVSMFYYQAFSKPLADWLFQGMSVQGLSGQNAGSSASESTQTKAKTSASPTNDSAFDPLPGYGVFYDSLYMTRIRQATAVLVELGFLTNPDEFERLMQPDFQRAQARQLAKLLKSYVATSGKL
jgi:N-acetylmuramoyl-L-alanine amidase